MNLIYCHNPIAAPWELGLLCSFSVHIRYDTSIVTSSVTVRAFQNRTRITPVLMPSLTAAEHRPVLIYDHPIFIMFKISIHRSLR
jgi:molybdenum cofactor biosynthesis enzyme